MEKETKYSLAELLENSRALFNLKPEVVSGALYGRQETEFTLDEAAQAIVNFLGREVE